MKANTRFTSIGIIVLIALVASIALPITAFADEAPTPPPSSDPSVSAQPAQPAQEAVTSSPAQPSDTSAQAVDTSAPAQPADTSASTEPPPSVDPSAPPASQADAPDATQDPATAVATDTTAPADMTTDINSPAATDTPVVVVNSDGTVEPLATQAAADIIATGDPMWCADNGSGCTGAHDTFTGDGGSDPGLLSILDAVPLPGTIYVAYDYDSTKETGTSVTLDGNLLINIPNYAITIQGGWGGAPGSTSTFSLPLTIINWRGDVTINDIIFTETSLLRVDNISGNISVNRITSNDKGTDGAYLNNTDGSGNIDVSNSTFNGNLANGLEAHSNGDVTLRDVTADSNHSSGARLGLCSESCGDISVSDSNFNDNTSQGDDVSLLIDTYGDVTLDNVTASNNRAGDGTDLYHFASLLIKDSNFNDNHSTLNDYGYGLFVSFTSGNVTLENVKTSGNSSAEYADGTYIATSGQVIVGSSQFTGNTSGSGLYIGASDVIINCSNFSNNADYGVNDKSLGPLTLSGNIFGGNGSGDYSYTGTATSNSANCGGGGGNGGKRPIPAGPVLPIHTIHVTGGEGNGLDCTQYDGTQLILPDNNSALFPCPISDSASLSPLTLDKLPGPLPNGDTFVSAFTSSVIKNGASQSPVHGMVTVSFVVPEDMKDANLALVYWDGSQWVEVHGGRLLADGHFEVMTDLTGTFVLVSR